MFAKYDQPLLCTTVKGDDADAFICRMNELREQGTEAFLLRLEYLLPENRTEETFRKIASAANGLPIYATDYRRFDKYANEDDECKAQALLAAARAGMDLLDVPGNMFTDEDFELTFDAEAVARQRKLIDEIHALGKKVLMSTHINRFMTQQEVLDIAREQQARGADVLKIVTMSGTAKELTENLDTTRVLSEEMTSGILFLSSGEYCRLHRVAGPYLGCCMWLATFEVGRRGKDQPLLSELKPLLERYKNC